MADKEQFKHLLVMAVADGSLNQSEIKLLSEKADQWGISQEEFETTVSEASSGDTRLTFPVGQEERHRLMRELVRTMASDGQVSDQEKQLFQGLADAMDITGDDLTTIISEAFEG